MKMTSLARLSGLIGMVVFAQSAFAGSICTIAEYTSQQMSAGGSKCGFNGGWDDYMYFQSSCDGGATTTSPSVMYTSDCNQKVTPWVQQESGYLGAFEAKGYHLTTTYAAHGGGFVFEMEK